MMAAEKKVSPRVYAIVDAVFNAGGAVTGPDLRGMMRRHAWDDRTLSAALRASFLMQTGGGLIPTWYTLTDRGRDLVTVGLRA